MIRTLAVAAAASFLLAGAASAQGDMSAVRDACAKDMQTYCNGVQPGGGRIMACFKEHQDKISPACKTALGQAMAARKASGGTAPAAGGTTQPH
jgi:hypothetical protein